MKKLFALLFIGLLIVQSCKKDNQENNDPINTISCSKSKFQTSISDLMTPSSVTEDYENNIYVLGNKEGEICIIKIDTSGAIVWNKSYPTLTGIASKLIVLNDNSIVISSFQNNTIEPITNLPDINNVWIQNSNLSLIDCNPYYELGDIDGYNIISQSFITRLDKNGNILWTNSYEECVGRGKSILRNSNGNINLVTMKLKGRVPILVYDSNGVFQDTINYPENDNIVNLYELDKNGSLLWIKEIKNIFNHGYAELSSNLDLQQTNNTLLVKTEKNIFFINVASDEIKSYTNHSEFCNNKNISLGGMFNSIVLSGYYITIDTISTSYKINNYIQKIDETQNIVWDFANSDIILDNNGNKFIAMSSDSLSINIYDDNCLLIKSFTTPASHIGIINCNNGITTVKKSNNQLIVTRTNSLGEY